MQGSIRTLALVSTVAACSRGEPPVGRATPETALAPPAVAARAPTTKPEPEPEPVVDELRLHPSTSIVNLVGITGDHDAVVIAVGAAGTIMRSTDHGRSWQQRPGATDRDLLATWHGADATWIAGDGGLLLRSRDGGTRWQALSSGTTRPLGHLAGNPSEVFAGGTHGTIVRSHDGGEHWNPIAIEDERGDILGLGSTRPGELWVLTQEQLRRSDDSGRSWRTVIEVAPSRRAFAQLWVGEGRFVVSGRNEHGTRPSFFVVTGRAGEDPSPTHWYPLETRLIAPPEVTAVPRSDGGEPRVVLAGDGYAVHWSDDGGASFVGSEQSVAMQSPYAFAKRALWVDADGIVFAAGSSGSLMRSSDRGEHWELLVDGAREPLFGGALSADGESIYAAVASAVLRGRAQVWELLSPRMDMPIGDGNTAPILRGLIGCCTDVWAAADGAIVAAGEGRIWRSTDDGASWTKTFDDPGRWGCCWSLWGDARGVHGVDRDVVLSSFDGGKTWSKRSLAKLLRRDDGNRFEIAGRGDELLVVGGKDVILRSRDRGKSWTREPSGSDEYLYGAFVGVATTGTRAAWVVGEHGTLLRSLDGGPWTPLEPGLDTRLQGIHGDDRRGELYLVGEHGLSRSIDDGASWTALVPAHRNLRSVFGDGRGRVLAIGDSGEVLRISG